MSKPDIILRAVLVGGAECMTRMEPTGDRVWVGNTLTTRYGWIGVPCRELDVLIDPGGSDVIEVGRKAGRYDGAIRTRIAIRSRHGGMRLERAVALRWDESDGQVTLSLADVVTLDVLWSASYRRLRAGVELTDLGRIVQWHQTRYYRMLDEDTAAVESATAGLVAASPETITAANRIASRALYAEATARGWRKLTARQQARLGLAGQWHSEQTLIDAYGRLRGDEQQVVGDYTLDAALRCTPEQAVIRARPWRADDDAEEAGA